MKFENCVSCAIGTAVACSSVFGVPFIKFYCEHRNTNQHEIIVRISKTKFSSALSILIFLIVIFSLCVINLKNSFQNEKPYFYAMIYTFDMMSILCSIVAMVVSMLHVNIIIDIANTFQRIIDKWQELTSQILLSKIDTLRIKKFINIQLCVIAVIMVGCIGILFFTEEDPNWSVLEKVGTFSSYFINFVMALAVITLLKLYLLVYNSYQNHLETELIRILFINKDLKNMLTAYAQLHIQLKKIVTQFGHFMNPTILLWIISSVVLLISSTSVLMLHFLEDEANPITARIIITHVEFYTFLLYYAYVGIIGTTIENCGSNSWQFLNKFQISLLSKEEATKFEILKSFFVKVNPAWMVSNMYIMGVRLVGAMCGTVITYVVVVLQFYIAWIKNKN